ncbi:MAG: DUF5711 family protein [Clostridiales bacterium]|jgi:hypothetical protein|nr:DUF5711 family protein [Clostridiales bacterium]
MAKVTKEKSYGKIVALIVLAVSAAVYLRLSLPGADAPDRANFASEGAAYPIPEGERAGIYSYGAKGFYLTTSEGMEYCSGGKPAWSAPYEYSLKEPLLAGNGKYVGVCDTGGTQFYLFSPGGLMYKRSYESKILSFYINPKGCAAVIAKEGEGSVIEALNPDGEQMNAYHSVSPGVFPTSADISPDAAVTAISFLDVNSSVPSSKVLLLYNDTEQRKNAANGIFYQEEIKDELAARLRFLSGGVLLVLTEASLSRLDVSADSGSARDAWKMPLGNSVESFAVSASGSIALSLGEPFPGKEGEEAGALRFYDKNLNLLASADFYPDPARLELVKDYFVAGSGGKYTLFNSKGRLIWEHRPALDTKTVLPLENPGVIAVLDERGARVMKRGN